MRVLVTGAAGLLGRAVVPLLRERGHVVTGADWKIHSGPDAMMPCDLLDERSADKAMRSIDAVVHLAGRRASVAQQHALAADLLLDNLAIDVNVFRAMRAHGVKRGVYASTVSVYPVKGTRHGNGSFTPSDFPFTEYDANRFPDDSVRFSAWGKLTAERMIEAMNAQDGANISVVRLVNTYGPHDNFGGDALVIPSLIKRYLGETEPRLVSADHERDFLYVEDAARGIVAALEHPAAGTWNLGTGLGVRIADVAALVAEACFPGAAPRWVHTGHVGSTGGSTRKVVDPSKAKRELGWEATTPLAEGIRRTVEWYRTQGVGT